MFLRAPTWAYSINPLVLSIQIFLNNTMSLSRLLIVAIIVENVLQLSELSLGRSLVSIVSGYTRILKDPGFKPVDTRQPTSTSSVVALAPSLLSIVCIALWTLLGIFVVDHQVSPQIFGVHFAFLT